MKQAVAFGGIMMIALVTMLFCDGCGYGKPACTVIDAMHNACAVIRYLGPDGKMHEVKLTPADLAALAEAKRVAKP